MIPVLVSGLESLLKTERNPATRQFIARVPMLAAAVGIAGVDRNLCDRMYDARSDWVHGSHVELFTRDEDAPGGPETDQERDVLAEVARLQDTLRAAVRTCIEDESCRAVFADDDAVRNRWRVPGSREVGNGQGLPKASRIPPDPAASPVGGAASSPVLIQSSNSRNSA